MACERPPFALPRRLPAVPASKIAELSSDINDTPPTLDWFALTQMSIEPTGVYPLCDEVTS